MPADTASFYDTADSDPSLKSLRALDHLGWRNLQLSAKHAIPESTRDAESVLVIREMMLEVVFLELLVIARQPVSLLISFDVLRSLHQEQVYSLAMMQKVMRQIVADVSEDTTTIRRHSRVPIVEEYCMSQFPEGRCEDDEEGWWHDQAVAIHR